MNAKQDQINKYITEIDKLESAQTMAAISLENMKSGEIKHFSSMLQAHKFMLSNPGWLVWRDDK